MEGELGALLDSVLSDPRQMAKISELAQELMASGGGGNAEPSADPGPSPQRDGIPGTDAGVLSALGRAFASKEEKNRSTALLMAMRPYMKPEKQEKLDRAMKIARMARIAGLVMREYGGGHGV